MKERNHEILQNAIAKLPKYEAPDFVWSNIEAVLIEDEQDKQITDAIPELPSYQAPESIWAGIETALESSPPVAKRRSLIVRLSRVAVAASFLGFAVWLGLNQFNGNPDDYTLVYSEEQVSQFEYDIDLEADEADFTAMLTQFESSVVAKQHDEYSALIDEFEEIEQCQR